MQGILDELRRRDIRVWADGELLRCDAPAGALTVELSDLLRENKPGILDFLRSVERQVREQRAIVPLQPHGTREPIFAVGGHNGDVYCYRLLAEALGLDQPFYGLQPPGSDEHSEPLTRVEHLAAYFASQIRSLRVKGCILAGYCAGGTIAFELARRLHEAGVRIRFLALFATPHPDRYRARVFLREHVENAWGRLEKNLRALSSGPLEARREYVLSGLRRWSARRREARASAEDPVLVRRGKVERATVAAASRYRAGFFAGRVCLFLPSADSAKPIDMPERWRAMAMRVEEYSGPPGCATENILQAPNVAAMAELFRACRAARL